MIYQSLTYQLGGEVVERRFHMMIYRLFHAQRTEMRRYGAALGLGVGNLETALILFDDTQGS